MRRRTVGSTSPEPNKVGRVTSNNSQTRTRYMTWGVGTSVSKRRLRKLTEADETGIGGKNSLVKTTKIALTQ